MVSSLVSSGVLSLLSFEVSSFGSLGVARFVNRGDGVGVVGDCGMRDRLEVAIVAVNWSSGVCLKEIL